ncbi:MAG: tetratricopeptide repeat protein [Anaerolineae bacterium]|jgi:tetratricopeptide (TPR) repeat protein
MTEKKISKSDRHKAVEHQKAGVEAYEAWTVDLAIEELEAAVALDPEAPEYRLNLAQALARSGDYDQALRVLAGFIRLEPNSRLTQRFEQLFASGMDDVEQVLTDKMTQAGMPVEEIGAALQMWLEYRVALGRERLIVRKAQTWAAALDYIVRKVNLRPVRRYKIAEMYGVSDSAVRDRHRDLIDTLDVMPCDYRYFTGDENPLDKLVEAAELLEALEARFRET